MTRSRSRTKPVASVRARLDRPGEEDVPLPGSLARHGVLAVQRTAGNAAVAGLLVGNSEPTRPTGPVLQREITITKVDFNPEVAAELEATQKPVDAAFTDYTIGAGGLQERLRPYVRPQQPVDYPAGNKPPAQAPVRTGITHNLNALQHADGISAPDVPQLARRLALRFKGETALTPAELGRLTRAVETALGELAFTLPEEKAAVFETLVRNAGGQGSRAKGIPTVIQHGQLPGALQEPVAAVATTIRNRNAALPGQAREVLGEGPPLPEKLSRAASEGLSFVRTVHTNLSGWLPQVAAPANPKAFESRVLERLPSKARANIWAPSRGTPQRHKDMYRKALERELPPPGRELVKLCWSGYSSVSGAKDLYPYVEFSVAGGELSRLIYDYVNGNFYVSLHYSWHKGYNPFFHVQGLADL